MSAVLDALITRNPLLAHGPRTHATGVPLLQEQRAPRRRARRDVDAPATLAELRAAPDHPMHKALPGLDFVFTYGGGPPVVAAYEEFGARRCIPIRARSSIWSSPSTPPRSGRR